MALTGAETLQVLGQDAKGFPAATEQQTTTGAIAALAASGSVNTAIGSLATVGAGTLTAALIVGKIVNRSGGQSGTGFTDTTDTAAAILTALPGTETIGQAFRFTYQNTTNAPATITGGTGVTVSGITVVKANSTAEFLITYTAANTLTMVGYSRGVYPSFGTFLAGGASATGTVVDAQVSPDSQIDFTVKTVAGAFLTKPFVKTITPGTGFTVQYGTADVSVYNYTITY